MRKLAILLSVLTLTLTSTFAQMFEPVNWKISLEDKGNGEVELTAFATIDPGWHLYDVKIPEGGPSPTNLTIDKLKGATKVGSFKAVDSKLISGFDEVFQMEIGYYDNQAKFVQRFKITDKAAFVLEGDIRAQACNDKTCTPPIPNDFSFSAKNLPSTLSIASAVKEEPKKVDEPILTSTEIDTAKVEETASNIALLDESEKEKLVNRYWTPVIKEVAAYGAAGSIDDNASFIWLLILGMGGGLIALMTPCVWPLIPMTVSFFLKRNKKEKGKAVKEAIIYGVGIIVIYVTLGMLVTIIFGASALNDLSTNAYFNIFFAAILIFFAISFFGAFEIVLPASWSNKIDSKAGSTTGVLSIFLMAFTLALVSFSCTGPVIGIVLVQAANTGALLGPIIVMFGFALALAIPFSLFALFPSWLGSLPKSGGWLNSVKVVLAFLELALALKFLSVADLAYGWRLLDREVFLVLWIVIFALLGMYLLGKLRFKHDDKLEYVSVTRLFLAIIPLSFAMYMVPGLWGAPLKNISAFAPPLFTQDFNLYDGAVHANFDDYEAGMEYAKRVNKPVIIDFSGFGCVNCRKMEAAVWSNPEVKNILENDYVLITLMVDDKTRLPEDITVTENNRDFKLKTIGDKWSYFQRHKFGTNSQPYYVLLDHDGMPIGQSYAYKEDVPAYLEFLRTGLNNFKEKQTK